MSAPYTGLRHDAALYLGQLLHHLAPGALSQDVFFAHGSQDSYSLYARLLGPIYQRVSLDVLQVGLLIVAQLGLLWATWRLVARQLGAELAFAAALVLLTLSHSYGGLGIFAFGEDFVTARTLAEPLVLWGLLMLVEGRRGWAGALLVLAASLHPLMSLPGLVLAIVLLAQGDRRWLWLFVAGALPALVLALLGKPPFDALLRRYDADWWALISAVNEQVLMQHWEWADWQWLLLDGGLLLAGMRVLPPGLALLCRATGLTALGLLLVAGLGGDVLRDMLIVQLQLWRVTWLSHWLALCVAPVLLLRLWGRAQAMPRLAALSVAIALVAAHYRWEQGWAMLLVAGLCLWGCRRGVTLSRGVARLAMGGCLLTLLALSIAGAWQRAGMLHGSYWSARQDPLLLLLLRQPAVVLALAGVSLWAWQARPKWRAPCAVLLLALLAVALLRWDARSEWQQQLERGPLPRAGHPFQALLPMDAQVYWHDELAPTWLLLGRASYFDKAQGAGLLFNRGTAQEFGPRWRSWQAIRDAIQGCRVSAVLTGKPEADCITPSVPEVRRLCVENPKLSHLVFERRLPSITPLASWDPGLPSLPEQRFHLYACAQLRPTP